MTEPDKIETQADLPSDSGLRCPGCGYNLTGVVEDRCPECGEAFDRAKLLAILAGAPAPIPIWDDESQWIVIRFIKICLLTWFLPARFGRTFPRRHSQASARKFRWAVVAVMEAVCLTLWGVSMRPWTMVGIILASIPFLTGVVLTEAMIAANLLTEQERPGSFSIPLDSPIGLIGFFRSFVLLQSVSCCLGMLIKEPPLTSYPPSNLLLYFGLVAVPLWWWAALSAAILVQPGRKGAKVTVVALVPMFVGFAILAAAIAGGFVAILITMLRGL